MNIFCKMPPPVSVENLHQNVQLIFTLTGWKYMGTKTWQKDPPTCPITVKPKSIWSANGNRDCREVFSHLVFAGTIRLLYYHACNLNLNKNAKYKTQRKKQSAKQNSNRIVFPLFRMTPTLRSRHDGPSCRRNYWWEWVAAVAVERTQNKVKNTKQTTKHKKCSPTFLLLVHSTEFEPMSVFFHKKQN